MLTRAPMKPFRSRSKEAALSRQFPFRTPWCVTLSHFFERRRHKQQEDRDVRDPASDSTPAADQTRSGQQLNLPAQVGLAALPQQPRRAGRVAQCHGEPVGRSMVVSIPTQREIEQPVHPSTSIAGIDVGITRFAVLSEGQPIKEL